MSQLTVNLPNDMAAELAEAGRESSKTPEELVQDLVRRMITLRRWQHLRRDVREQLGPDAPASEEEVFEQIS